MESGAKMLNKSSVIKILAVGFATVFLSFGIPNHVMAISCDVNALDPMADDCNGPIAGNDNEAAVSDFFGISDWDFLQKKNTPGDLDTDVMIGLAVSPDAGAPSGTWSVTPGALDVYNLIMIVLKAGNQFVAYLYNDPLDGGTWDTRDLDNNDLSHLSVYASGEGTPVPEPATMLLLGAGLIGLAGFGRKRILKKNKS